MRGMPHRLVFLDETSTSTKMIRPGGREGATRAQSEDAVGGIQLAELRVEHGQGIVHDLPNPCAADPAPGCVPPGSRRRTMIHSAHPIHAFPAPASGSIPQPFSLGLVDILPNKTLHR